MSAAAVQLTYRDLPRDSGLAAQSVQARRRATRAALPPR